MLQLKIDNSQGTPQVRRHLLATSKATSRALISAGYYLRQSLKTGIKAEAPGGEAWPRTHPWTRYGILRTQWRTRTYKFGKTSMSEKSRVSGRSRVAITGKKTALARLAGAACYVKQVFPSPGGGVGETAVRIGFLTPSAARRARYHAESDHVIQVTPRMRRYLFAMGVLPPRKIVIPKRRHAEPVEKANRQRVINYVRSRVITALSGGSGRDLNPGFK